MPPLRFGPNQHDDSSAQEPLETDEKAPSHSISVALCTYNGSAYLREQLDSIAAQTLLPRELVVCDDCSEDDTVTIIQTFATTAAFPVHLHVQPSNRGWQFNRQECYRHCTGDLIAVCDQDDRWKPHKLATLAGALLQSPEALLAFCDCDVVDRQLNPLGYTSWELNGFSVDRQRRVNEGHALATLLPHSPISDACLMFRSKLLQTALPLPTEWAPDAWIVLTAASIAKVIAVAEPLQLYRQHGSNQLGGGRKSIWTRYIEAKRAIPNGEFARQQQRFQSLRDRVASAASAASLEMIDTRARFAGVRHQMRQRPLIKPWLVLQELARGSYHRLGGGWRSALLDLIL